MITQVSTVVTEFTTHKWEDMTTEQRGATLNQLGKSVTGLVVDIMGFHPVF